MTVLLYVLGVVLFVTALVVSIGLHELGHLTAAKAFGAKVTQYFVGFGRTLWSRQVGETEYGVKAIPLGGFVKILGMLPPEKEAPDSAAGDPEHEDGPVRVRKSNTGLFTQLISDARSAEYELVSPGDEDRLFYRLSWWKKVIVMAAGPTVNVLIALAIFTPIFAFYGNPADYRTTPVVDVVADCVIPANENRACRESDPPTPAREAGMRPGDRFVSFNGTPVTDDWRALQKLIQSNANGDAVIVVERDGRELTLKTNTTVTARPTDPQDPTQLTQVGFLGVVPHSEIVKGGLGYTLGRIGSMTVDTAQALVTLPARVFDVAQAIVGLERRDPNGPVSIVGGGRFAGEVAATDQIGWIDKSMSLLLLIAAFNFFVGLFNFVPLLPLDGGHIVGAIYEGTRRGLARLFGRPDPGYVDVAKLLPIAYVVGAALMIMGVVLIVGDLVVPLRISG